MATKTSVSNPAFMDEDAARKWLEKSRWPNGPVCPFCKSGDHVKPLEGKSMGPGWYHCNDCRDKFTVRVGTLYERSHIPLHKWLLATHLLTASKKGISAHQLHRMLGITYKSAWFMAHRIRAAMVDANPTPLGGEGKTVQADETKCEFACTEQQLRDCASVSVMADKVRACVQAKKTIAGGG